MIYPTQNVYQKHIVLGRRFWIEIFPTFIITFNHKILVEHLSFIML
jgi:hypothetical protein